MEKGETPPPIKWDSADSRVYAEEFARSEIIGVRYLAFRDLPQLLEKYVHGTKTLDYGCGAAISTTVLKSHGLEVEGVDVNAEMVRKARERDPAGRYSVIQSGVVSAPDSTYDLVLACFVLLEVSTKEELARICREVARVLKPNGAFIVMAAYEASYNMDWSTINSQFEENRVLRSGATVKMFLKDVDLLLHQYFWSKDDYRDACRRSGMDIVHEHYPRGTLEDGFQWTHEMEVAPLAIYVFKKASNSMKIACCNNEVPSLQ